MHNMSPVTFQPPPLAATAVGTAASNTFPIMFQPPPLAATVVGTTAPAATVSSTAPAIIVGTTTQHVPRNVPCLFTCLIHSWPASPGTGCHSQTGHGDLVNSALRRAFGWDSTVPRFASTELHTLDSPRHPGSRPCLACHSVRSLKHSRFVARDPSVGVGSCSERVMATS